ncbi:MAG: class I SAM-dependent methyltransferase [Spirochaetota bacterium]|nr:MAG: class I SAM-dependent methyltransferase [Spirochaetota bacterium]
MNEYKPDWGDKDRIKQLIERFSLVYTELFWKSISNHLQEDTPFGLLDIGCGPGLFMKEISKRFPKASLCGADEKPEMLQEARKRVPEADLIQGLVDEKFISSHNKKYDIIYAGLVFHELDNQINFLDGVRKQLINKGGLLIIYDFVIVPFDTYVKAYVPFMSKDDIIQRYPKPAKFLKNDIEFLFKETGWSCKATYDVLPVTALFIASIGYK